MIRKHRERPKKSLQNKLFVLINITIFTVIVICILVNSLAFQDYYMLHKSDLIFERLSEIEALLNNDDITVEEMRLEMEKLCINSNIQAMIYDKNNNLIYTSVPENAYRFKSSGGFDIFIDGDTISVTKNDSANTPDSSDRKIIKKGRSYVISTAHLRPLNTQVIELYAITRGDYFVFIQSSIAPIRESVLFSNRFLITIGIIVWLIAAIIVTLLGNRLVRPLRQLSEIARRMAQMDFSQKYTGDAYDEVGMLGESINTMSNNLEKAISSLKATNIQLMRDIDKKEKIDKQRSEFMSSVSHELKTPISIIEAYAEGLNEMELDDESRAYYCDVILDEARKMNVLIKKLMALMRIESGTDKLDISRFDIVEQIREIMKQKSILLEQSGVTAELTESGPIYVWADDFLIEEAFLNYLTNAIKYCSGEKKIRVSIEKLGNNVRVSVFNTGEAISDEVLENMWKNFYMADKARVRENGSQGLGLSIVATIIKAHNHDYGAYNTDGGVVFYFELDGKYE